MTSSGSGTTSDPWLLTTLQVGSTKLRYLARCLDDVPAFHPLAARGQWVELGSADENKPVKDGTLEACARLSTAI